MIPKILKNFNLFVDGRGYAGVVNELNLPTLAIKTEDYRAGGMDTSIQLDLGMDQLTCDFTLNQYDSDVINAFGLSNGAQVPLVFRGGLSDEATVSPVVVTLTGAWNQVDMGGWTAGDRPTLKVTVSVRYYKLEIDGKELIEIDVLNMVRKINGTDQLAKLRTAIGM